jgi:hypothetical protein
VISLYANAATDFGHVCASLADLSARGAEHTRSVVSIDVTQLDSDIARLADLTLGLKAQKLASEIRARLVQESQ